MLLLAADVNRMDCPVAPVVLVQRFSLLVQEEFDKLVFKVVVLSYMDGLKLWWFQNYANKLLVP